MLVVDVNIWPFGERNHKRQIGRLKISLLTPGQGDSADYECRLGEGPPFYVRGHDRNDGAWKLVEKAIGILEQEQPTGCRACGGRIMHKMNCYEFVKEVVGPQGSEGLLSGS